MTAAQEFYGGFDLATNAPERPNRVPSVFSPGTEDAVERYGTGFPDRLDPDVEYVTVSGTRMPVAYLVVDEQTGNCEVLRRALKNSTGFDFTESRKALDHVKQWLTESEESLGKIETSLSIGRAIQDVVLTHVRNAEMLDALNFTIDAEVARRYAAAFPTRLAIENEEDEVVRLSFGAEMVEPIGAAIHELLPHLSRESAPDAVVSAITEVGREHVEATISAHILTKMHDDLAALERARHATEHEALEAQTSLARFFGTATGVDFARAYAAETSRLAAATAVPAAVQGEYLAAEIRQTMQTATTWFVTEEMRDLATWAASSLPAEFALTSDMLISPSGFVLIEGGLPVGADSTNERSVFRALSWAPSQLVDRNGAPIGPGVTVTFYADRDDPRSKVMLEGFAGAPREQIVHVTGFQPGDWVSHWDDDIQSYIEKDLVDVDPGVSGAPTNPFRWLVSFWMLVEQPIVVDHPLRVHRGTARRAEREGILPPEPGTVRIVRMREIRQRDNGSGEDTIPLTGGRRAYSHRFYVRPHWKRFHTKNGVEWRPVVGYVKGPEDKPFVAKSVVYEWSR